MPQNKLILCLVFIYLSFLNFSVNAKSTLWKVEGVDSNIYLLGSIHLGKKHHYPLPEDVLAAFNQVDSIAVELDITKINQLNMMKKLMELGKIETNNSLANILSPRVHKKLRNHLTKKPIPFSDSMKPWLLSQIMVLNELTQAGFSDVYGIDKFFIRKATRLGKPILELEDINTQLNALSSMGNVNPDIMIDETLSQLDTVAELMESLFTAWRSGDLAKIHQLTLEQSLEDESYQKVYKALLTDRNLNMTKKIQQYIKEKRSILVIVGAAHFIGKNSILELLQKKGYRISQH